MARSRGRSGSFIPLMVDMGMAFGSVLRVRDVDG